MRQSGICMELQQNHSVFLLENGRFVSGTPIGNPTIGEVSSFYPTPKSTIRWQPVMAPLIAGAAACMLFLSAIVFPTEEAYSYVQVEINPGIELGINQQYEVISVRELNKDGHDLIHQMGKWENNSLQEVVNRVFELAITPNTKQITVTAVEESNRNKKQSIKKVILAASSKIQTDQIAIQMKQATKEQWRDSKEKQVPVGKLIHKTEILPADVESKRDIPVENQNKLPEPIEIKSKPPQNSNNPASSEKQEETNIKKEKQEINKEIKKSQIPLETPSQESSKSKQVPKEKSSANKEKGNSGNTPSEKSKAPGQQKKSVTPPVKKEKGNSGNNSSKKDRAPGQQKKSVTPPVKKEKGNSGNNSSEKDRAPGQQKKQQKEQK